MAAPISRSHLFFEKAIGLGTALVVIGGLISLGIFVGGLVIQDPFPLVNAGLQGLDIAAHAAVFGALALFLSQLTLERGTAAGLAGLLLGISFLLDSVGRTVPELASLRYASTIYYFGLNKPLLPGYDTDLGALLVLAGLLAVFIIGAGWLFVRRDVGAPGWVAQARTVSELVKPAAYPRTLPRLWPYRSFWRSSPYTRSLQQTWRPTFWWGLAIGALAATLSGSAGAGHVSLVLSMLPILFAIFAVTQVSRWAYSEPEGRLELLLTAPVERSAALTSAFGAFAIALLLLGIFTLAGLGIAAQLAGLGLPWDNLAAAAFGLVPATLLVGSIGFLLTAWLRPGTAIGILIVLLGASLTLGYVGPALDWPEFVAKLSPVAQYGQPLLNGFDLTAMARLVVLAGIALALASFRFSRKDIL
jgi:ABC-2 type transport system permease protein